MKDEGYDEEPRLGGIFRGVKNRGETQVPQHEVVVLSVSG
jgi:hypothetical protein